MNMHQRRILTIAIASLALGAGPAAATLRFKVPVQGAGSFKFSLEPGASYNGFGISGSNKGARVTSVTQDAAGVYTLNFEGAQPDAAIHIVYSGKGKYSLNGGPPTPGVPEPAAWLTMIAGFGTIGAMQRRRRQMVKPA